REAFARTFGKPPGHSREAGCVVVDWVESPIGPLLVGAATEGICLLEFTDRRALGTPFTTGRRPLGCALGPGQPQLLAHAQQLAEYFDGSRQEFSVPLSFPGSPFQRAVWEQLLRIPYGETRSYEDLAVAVGQPKGPRAVGRANGQNRIAILIPCHRVVNKGG